MEVRRRDGHIAQAGHLEHMAVFFILGQQVAPQVRFQRVAAGLEVIAHHAEFLEHIAANVHALVTGNAAVILEALVAVFFLAGQDIGVAQQVLVKPRVGCQQRALVGGQGVLHIGSGDAIGIGLFERVLVGGQGGQVAHHGIPVAAHFHRADHHLLDLGLQRVHPTVPELFEVQAGVEYGRGIDLHRFAVKANGEWLVVGAAAGQLVTARAGQGVVDRQARLIEQLATQLNLGRVQYWNRRQGLERFVQRCG